MTRLTRRQVQVKVDRWPRAWAGFELISNDPADPMPPRTKPLFSDDPTRKAEAA